MSLDIKFHDAVITKDGRKLGVAQRLFTKVDPDELETQTYEGHLKVFDFESGDVYYLPMETIASTSGNEVTLDLDHQAVLDRSYSRLPRYIAYESMSVTELAK